MPKEAIIYQPRRRKKRKRLNDATLAALTFSFLTLSLVDYTIHSNSGISNPQTREFFYNHFGGIIRHVGNFILAAAPATALTLGKKILQHSSTKPEDNVGYDNLIEYGYKASLIGLFASIMLVEGFPNNNELPGDLGMSFWGIINSIILTDELGHRLRLGRRDLISKNADIAFPEPNNLPASVDRHNFLSDIPTSLAPPGYLSSLA